VLGLCSPAAGLVFGTSGVQRASGPRTGAIATGAASLSRRQALGSALVLPFVPAVCVAADAPTATKSGVGIKVLKTGSGGQPVTGDLCAIRFKGTVTASGQVFDDIMETPEPYYFRIGTEKVLPGVEEAVKLMHTGDVWELSVPGKLGFGDKGRSASPGKPRIPSNADLTFLVELSAVPGKDEEIIDLLEEEKAAAAPSPSA